MDVDPRAVLDGGDDVGGEAVVQVAAVLELDLFQQRPAEGLEGAALDLTRAERLVNGPAHLADGRRLEGPHGQGVRIDLHLDHVRAPGVGGIGRAAVGRLVEGLVRGWLVAEGDLQRASLLPVSSRGFAEALAGSRPGQHPVAQLGDGPRDQRAHDHGGARSDGGAGVGDVAGVRWSEDESLGADPGRRGGDLGEDRHASLAHVGHGREHLDAAIREEAGRVRRLHLALAVSRETRAVKIKGKTDPTPGLAVRGALLPGLLQGAPLRPEARAPLRLLQTEAGRGGRIQHLAGGQTVARLDDVAGADLVGVEPQGAADPVHLALDGEFDLGSAEAAEGAVRRRVGAQHLALETDARPAVGAEGVEQGAREHHGRQGLVGAAVEEDLAVEREQPAVAVDRRAVADHRRVALGGADDVLVPVVDHLHRPLAGAGEQGGVEGEGAREVLLAAEAAAHHRGPHPHPVLRQPEAVSQRPVDVVRALHGARDEDAGDSAVVRQLGDHPLALDVDVLLVAGPVLPLDHVRRPAQGLVHVAALQAQLVKRRQLRRLREREDRRERLVFDGHGRQRLPGREASRSRHQLHWLADVEDEAVGEDRPAVVQELDAVRTGEVRGGDADGAGRGRVRIEADGADPRVGVRAAHRGAVPHAGHGEVVHVARRSRDLGEAVRARRALSDAVHGTRSLEQCRGRRNSFLEKVESADRSPGGSSREALTHEARPVRVPGTRVAGRRAGRPRPSRR